MKRKVGARAAVLLTLAIFYSMGIFSAFAHEKTAIDPDDSPGPLDLVAARFVHRTLETAQSHPERFGRVTELRFRLVTYEKWNRQIATGAHNFLAVEFNLDDDAQVERCAVVTDGDHEMLGRLYRRCTYFDDPLISTFSVSRPDKHSIRFTVDRWRLGRGVDEYLWRAVTSFEQENDPVCPTPTPHGDGGYGACADFTDWVRHRH